MCARYMITQEFSLDQGYEFGSVYIKIYRQFPSYIKILANSPYVTTTESGDVHIYTLIEIPDKITGEGLKEITVFFNKYNVIENYKWRIETLIKRKEALKLAGLSIDNLKD